MDDTKGGNLMNNFLSKKEKKELEQDLHSVPMVIIMKLKKQLNFLLILDLILCIFLCFSFYDSIKVRDDYWHDHTNEVIEAIQNHCENEQWQN